MEPMPYYIKVIFATFIISLIGLSIKANRVPILILFSLFILGCGIAEYTGWQMSVNFQPNLYLYDYFTLSEFIFFLFFFRYILPGRKRKRAILLLIIIFTACGLADIYILQKGEYLSYTFMLGCALMVVFSIMYFNYLFRVLDGGSLARNPFFWIVIGLMFYYTGSFALNGLSNVITRSMKSYSRLLRQTGDFLNVLEYTLFAIGYLCRLNFRNSSAS